ncbi:pyridoxal-phosphate dependent enzyme [Rugamonas sp. A1-17]|nr:pyridoxal-phosphate dependent enzyme [Rugamonas sp. A1-17]
MGEAARRRGIVAVSAGNHAIAAAYAARLAGCGAKVVMPRHASPARIAACRELGAEVLLMPDVHQAFARGREIERDEMRTMLHPYEGPLTAQGTATVGLELMAQVPRLDAVVVPVGGGGLCAGIAAAVKQINPACAVYGAEPFGADALYRSFASGQPEALERVDTVADSLGAPYAMPYSFGVCRRFVDEVVRVTDDEICLAMLNLFRDAKLVAEPAAAVATAALFGPLRERLAGKRVGVLVCGSNIDPVRFAELLARGARVRGAGLGTAMDGLCPGSVQ